MLYSWFARYTITISQFDHHKCQRKERIIFAMNLFYFIHSRFRLCASICWTGGGITYIFFQMLIIMPSSKAFSSLNIQHEKATWRCVTIFRDTTASCVTSARCDASSIYNHPSINLNRETIKFTLSNTVSVLFSWFSRAGVWEWTESHFGELSSILLYSAYNTT